MNQILKDQSGLLSIESKNIFTILRKWLYTEKDIVFRELISNASDAIEKLSQLKDNGNLESEVQKGQIYVRLDIHQKRLIISDNGIGMSREEVNQYINQIAFSGASDFINNNDHLGEDTIIGHFGVGFYSAFTISDHVAIDTKSYKEGAFAVRWDCLADMSYQMKRGTRVSHGTDVILYLADNSPYLSNPALIYDIIKKYFIFSKTEIYFEAPDFDTILVNEPNPLWRQPQDTVKSSDMNAFYRSFFDDVYDPLFFIQFESIDIGIRGILFFRNTKNGTEEIDGKIKVYSRGVYVGENIQALIPKYVNLQSGIIECDHLPLVVSRSTLKESEQADDIFNLTYECLSQEVTIAMNNLFKNDRSTYEIYWSNLNAFVKYGLLQDKIFASVMMNKVIFMDIYGHYCTIQEYVNDKNNRHKDTVYYASDGIEQAHYIELFKKCQLNALLFDHVIDQPFMQKYELIHSKTTFTRIDSNIETLFEGTLESDDDEKITLLTQKIQNTIGNRLGSTSIKISRLDNKNISALIINDEKSRRMADMLEIYGIINSTDFQAKEKQSKRTFLINLNNSIVNFILTTPSEPMSTMFLNQLYDLALMSQQTLAAEDVEQFIHRSESILDLFSLTKP